MRSGPTLPVIHGPGNMSWNNGSQWCQGFIHIASHSSGVLHERPGGNAARITDTNI